MSELENTEYGFRWGNMEVTRLSHIEGRGRVIAVSATTGSPVVQVYVSEGGRSIRVFKGSREMRVVDE